MRQLYEKQENMTQHVGGLTNGTIEHTDGADVSLNENDVNASHYGEHKNDLM